MRKYLGLLATTGLATLPAVGTAAAPSLSDVLGASGISAQGYADASYQAVFNQTNGATGQVQLHEFDNNANSFKLNQAALTLSYLPSSGFGALVNMIAGEDAKVVNSAYSSSNSNSDFALAQGYVQYATGNLTVIGGRFFTLAGAEVTDDTKNANISRSLLFTNAEPFVHTGVRASYKFNDQLTGYLGVNNTALGGANAADADKQKTAEFSLAYTPTSAISVALTDYYGVDNSGGVNVKNNFADLVGSWQATSALQFVLNGDYVRSIGQMSTLPSAANSAFDLPAGNDSIAGVAGYVNYTLNDQWKGSLRAEHLYIKGDANNGENGAVHVSELTATVDYSATKNFDVLAEGRVDYSSYVDVNYSDGEGGFVADSFLIFPGADNSGRKSQPEILVKAIYKFGTPST